MDILKKVFGLGRQRAEPVVLTDPEPDRALYVVGDIHGRDDLAAHLIDQIETDIAEHGVPDPRIVFVGDYVDRGDASAQVLERLHALEATNSDRFVCLSGNHEEMMLDFMDEPGTGPRWLRNGGLQTLASYRIGGVTETSDETALADAAARLREALGAELEAWLRGLRMTVRSGNVVVVHAALDPRLAPEGQSDHVLTWGHPAFLRAPRTDGLCVVHGHTIVDHAELLPSRIPVDTGAVFTGRLTAAVLMPGAPLRLLQT